MNITVLVGRLTRDPDLRYTQNGTAVASFNLAVDRPFSKGKETDFINCVAWRKQAENLAQYMKKGDQIGVDGRIQTRTYDDKDGKKVYVTEVVADSVQFLESRQKEKQPKTAVEAYNEQIKKVGKPIEVDDSDLPL